MTSLTINDSGSAISVLKTEQLISYQDGISGVTISNESFTNVSLVGLVVDTCTFINCDFTNASFYDAVFRNVLFDDCNFTETDLDYTELENTKLRHCTVTDLLFRGSKADSVTMTDCIGAVSFLGSFFYDFKATSCDFSFSNFKDAELSQAAFIRCNLLLTEIDCRTNLEEAVFRSCDITQLELIKASGTPKLYKCISKPSVTEDDLFDFGVSLSVERGKNSETYPLLDGFGFTDKAQPNREEYKACKGAYLSCSDTKILHQLLCEVSLETIHSL
jgi:uncharacterized protein YjbI with pentapeptide repeats